ncbi:unnamed protein product [Owenia fusiformis]|uniref:Uncharacterized protein n=1 Tax=Owenia fusiformis TaxID=6347 RepID=A0A8J1TS30_OWEFU|nr:unnamed protein product [Owenia fusiformis]
MGCTVRRCGGYMEICYVLLGALCWMQIARAYVVNDPEASQEIDSITCWTCPEKANNHACNRWAPDVPCHKNHTVCHTHHRYDSLRHKTISVTKTCARASECTHNTAGCTETDVVGIYDCISCCNKAYCNRAIPSNHSEALRLTVLSGSDNLKLSKHIVWIISIVYIIRYIFRTDL